MSDDTPPFKPDRPTEGARAPALRFSRHFVVAWGAVDANDHMRNTAYFDAAADVRLAFLESRGWDRDRLAGTGLGMIAFEERVTYRRELRLRDGFSVTLELAGVSADGARVRLRSVFLDREEHELATLTSDLGWMDRTTRRVAPVPGDLAEVFLQLACTADFALLESRRPAAVTTPNLRLVPPDGSRDRFRTSRA
jgi:acyl-CoA thioester hydrolase